MNFIIMNPNEFKFQIISYKGWNVTDVFIYTFDGGYHLLLQEYLGFFKKMKLNSLFNRLKDRSITVSSKPFIEIVMSEMKREGFNPILKEDR